MLSVNWKACTGWFLRYSRKRTLVLSGLMSLVLAWMVAVVPAISQPPPVPATELRGVWLTNVDSDVLFSSDRLTNALERLDRLHFNTLYPTVWNEGYTLYPSAVGEEVTGRAVLNIPGLQRRDMLKEAIEQGHKRGMSVLPWLEFGFMAPAESELVKRHPEWIANRADGSQVVMQGIHPRVWLNPVHPQVQQLMVDLVTELVNNYDIDGIQLDDHFGLPVELGYDAYTRQVYQSEHNGQPPPDDPEDAAWIRWRADRITTVMARIFAAVKSKRPDAIISLSPNPQHFAYSRYLQDWFSWERQGFVEELLIQIYRDDLDRFQMELKRPEVQVALDHIPVGIGVLTGLKNRSVPMSQIEQQVAEVRKGKFAGVSFFFYETLWNLSTESPQKRQTDWANIFPQPAARPSILHCWGN
ncbi:glycoside hydrolase family 10 protein [Roseofilum sp. BLCC_M154]|uniref:Glycoside hydrolase family 10 protein n=1 Tax=Roseofilum acuticapitatum BLCC-M154 TaxID=3022444 RepID=A0ABT7AW40_9CYAN|nr:glycoside hydrolase family 10 protein [Roseofilum acuticapitatum]MDJ1171133.1 glycoside hydrolase family 10 protein [Roseofilum acuticapitatum BLCC-M154]